MLGSRPDGLPPLNITYEIWSEHIDRARSRAHHRILWAEDGDNSERAKLVFIRYIQQTDEASAKTVSREILFFTIALSRAPNRT